MQVVADRVGICVDEFVVQEGVYALERGNALVDLVVFVGELTHRRSSPA